MLLCVWLSSLYVSVWLWLSQWLVTSRHSVHCLQNGVISPESSKIVTFSAKKSLGCYHHRDILRFPAILVEKSDDFCYNRDEKRRKSRVSVVLSFPQVVGNAITSTIATLHQHKKVKRKINLVPGFSDVQRFGCNSNPTFWCREPERGHEPDTK